MLQFKLFTTEAFITILVFLNEPFPASFFFMFVFSVQLTENKCSILKFADDWI